MALEAATLEELSMQQTLVFADSLKDLRTLRSQLYSAAEYFELAYTKDEQKHIVVRTLKDYAVKALVNTVDHLGSISFKVTSLVDHKVEDVAATAIRVTSIQQRVRTYGYYGDCEGRGQQSLLLTAPNYFKRYILPAGKEGRPDAAVPNYREINRIKVEAAHHFHDVPVGPAALQRDKHHSFRRLRSLARAPTTRARSVSPSRVAHSHSPSSNIQAASATMEEKRSVSPLPAAASLKRSGSVSKKASLLKSASVRVQDEQQQHRLLHAERDQEQLLQSPKKSNKFLKSLLSRRKTRKDDDASTFSTYLHEY